MSILSSLKDTKRPDLPWYRYVLPKLLAELTGRPRYLPAKLEWSTKIFTSNIFRALDWLFFRAYGENGIGDTICPDVGVNAWADEYGVLHVHRQFFTLEALFAHAESLPRAYIAKAFELRPELGYIPQPVYLTLGILGFNLSLHGDMHGLLAPLIGMVVATDTSNTNHQTGSTTATIALTVTTSSDRVVWAGFTANKVSVPAVTSAEWAGAAMTASTNSPKSMPSDVTCKPHLYYKLAAASGPNNCVITFASVPDEINSSVVAYSGVGSVPQDTSTSGTGGTETLSITTTIDNSWLVGVSRNNNNGDGSAGTATTKRAFVAGQSGFYDSGGAKTPTGSYSLVITHGSAEYAAIGMSMAPVTSNNYTPTLSETVTLTDSLARVAGRILSETVTLTATALKTAGKVLLESLALAATFTDARAYSAGPNSPGTMADDAAVGATTWLNPDNAKTSNNVYSTTTDAGGTASHYLKASNFGFSIPSNAVINGVLVGIERKDAGSQEVRDSVVKLTKGGTVSGTNKADTGSNWPPSDAYASYGGAADLWGIALTPSDINDSGFGAVLAVSLTSIDGAVTASVDHMRITVHYSLSGNLYTQALDATVTLTDAVAKTGGKVLSDTLTFADAIVRTMDRVLADTATLTASVLKTAGRTLSDTVTQSDAFEFLRGQAAILSETVTLAASALRSAIRTLAETVTYSDNFEGARVLPLALSETLSVTAALIRDAGRALVESLSVTDALTSLKVYARTFSETVDHTAELIKTGGKLLLDSVTMSDTFTRVWTVVRVFSESALLTDTFRWLRNGSDIIWINVAKAADAVLSNAAKHIATLSTQAKNAATWINQDKS